MFNIFIDSAWAFDSVNQLSEIFERPLLQVDQGVWCQTVRSE